MLVCFVSSGACEFQQGVSLVCVWVQLIKTSLGPLPFFKEPQEGEEEGEAAPAPSVPAAIQKAVRPAVLADGSYATQTALPGADAAAAAAAAAPGANLPNLRCVLLQAKLT